MGKEQRQMKDFAGYITQYFKERGLNYTSAAKMCGIDRTLLGRYASGARLPKKANVAEGLAKRLQMSEEEEAELLEAYRRTRVCREYHVDYASLEAIIEGDHRLAAAMPLGSRKEIFQIPQEHSRNLHSMEEVLSMIRQILEGASWVQVLASPQYPKAREILQCMAMDLPQSCRIEQMIGVGQHEWRHGEGKLLNLGKLLPLLLQEREYQVFYHYQWESGTEKTGKELDYAITDKGMVLFSQSLEVGFFTNQTEPCSYYAKMYEDRKAICRPFALGGRGAYRQWRSQPRELSLDNPRTGIRFSKSPGENCVWMVKERQECAACIEEMGTVQLLERFLWDVG